MRPDVTHVQMPEAMSCIALVKWNIKHHYMKIRVPRVLRTDRGTESAHVAFIQPTFRHSDPDDFAGINNPLLPMHPNVLVNPFWFYKPLQAHICDPQ